MSIDPQQIAQRIIDTIARTQGDSSNSSGESFVVSERVIRDRKFKKSPTQPKGKIKYLYSVLNADSSRDLWLGGWQPKPVKIKAIAANEGGFYLRNTGSDRYFIDYGQGSDYVSFTNVAEVYRSGVTSALGGIGQSLGYSFAITGNSGSGPGGYGYWAKLFQGVLLTGLNTDFYGKVYLLPNLISPTGATLDSRGFIYQTYAINQAGTHGVGVRIAVTTTQIATYGSGIVDTGISPDDQFLGNQCFDCFDNSFSAIDTTTFSTDIFSKPQFTGNIGIYGFDASQKRTIKTAAYGIPSVQRRNATLIGRPSYHP